MPAAAAQLSYIILLLLPVLYHWFCKEENKMKRNNYNQRNKEFEMQYANIIDIHLNKTIE